MNKEKIILVGGGGHCLSCIDVIEASGKFTIAGIIDVKSKIGEKVAGYPIVASDDDLNKLVKEYKNFFITIGQIKSAKLRAEKFIKLKELGTNFPVICSPRSHVARTASLGEGSIIMHDVVVNSGARVGSNCIINSKALIEHESMIGDHTHIATGAIVNGQCNVGSEVLLGSGSILINNINIADRVVIGAGSVVVKDVSTPGTYIGAPCKKIIK